MDEQQKLHKLLQDVDLSQVDELPPVHPPTSFDVQKAEESLSEHGKRFLAFKRAAESVGFTPTTAQMIDLAAPISLDDLIVISDISMQELCPDCRDNIEQITQDIEQEIKRFQRMTPKEFKAMIWRTAEEM